MVFVITSSKQLWIHEAILSESTCYFDKVMTKFIVNNRTDASNTDVNLFFTIHNCPLSLVDASHKL